MRILAVFRRSFGRIYAYFDRIWPFFRSFDGICAYFGICRDFGVVFGEVVRFWGLACLWRYFGAIFRFTFVIAD